MKTRAFSVTAILFAALSSAAFAAPMDGRPDPWVVDGICASRFGGDFASVLVYRDDERAVMRYELRPDITKASHPPTTIYDARGQELLVIPEHPIIPGSAEAEEIARKRRAAIDGGRAAETLACAAPVKKIHEILGLPAARFVIAGVVARAYACPPCPPGAQCKPCLPDHVVLSERADLAANAPLGDSEVVVFTSHLRPTLTIGQRYRMRVAETQVRQTFGNNVPDLELLAVDPLRE